MQERIRHEDQTPMFPNGFGTSHTIIGQTQLPFPVLIKGLNRQVNLGVELLVQSRAGRVLQQDRITLLVQPRRSFLVVGMARSGKWLWTKLSIA